MNDKVLGIISSALKAAEQDVDQTYDGLARAVALALSSAGFVVVPREPTPKMVAATWDEPTDKYGSIESQNTRNVRIYKAMLAAAGGGGE